MLTSRPAIFSSGGGGGGVTLATSPPPAVAGASATGTGTSAARNDHTHQALIPSDTALSFTSGCVSHCVVGDVVYLSAADTVDQASATSTATGPALGVITSKPTSTSCVVQYQGPLTGLSGLTVGTYYVGTTAGTRVASTSGYTTGNYVQAIGFAKDATTLFVQCAQPSLLVI